EGIESCRGIEKVYTPIRARGGREISPASNLTGKGLLCPDRNSGLSERTLDCNWPPRRTSIERRSYKCAWTERQNSLSIRYRRQIPIPIPRGHRGEWLMFEQRVLDRLMVRVCGAVVRGF